MATMPVPLFESVQKGVDSVELNEENFSLFDGYKTLKGGTTSRPGSRALFTISDSTGFAVDGLFYWPEKDCVIAVGGGEVYKLTYTASTPVVTSLTSGTPLLNTNEPVSFTSDATNVYIANGGRIVYSPINGPAAYISDVDAPITTQALAYLDGYILAIDGTNKFYWSEANAGENWQSLNFASQSGSPDLLVGLRVFNREIYLLGQKSVEVWENDGATPFARIPGGFIECGCSASNSVLVDENSIYWLDDNRRLVRFNGKNVERLSTRYDKEFQSLSHVADCVSMKMCMGGHVFFVFSFPRANRTFVYNQTVDDWSDFARWDYSQAEYNRWIANSYCYAQSWGRHLIGRRDKLVVAELSRSFSTDDGDIIRLARTTGHIDFGTAQTKRSNELRFRAKRGDGLSSGVPKLMVRYRLDNKEWSNLKELSLGAIGEYWSIIRDPRRCIFRTKQYEFSATDAVNIVFSSAEEDIEVLR